MSDTNKVEEILNEIKETLQVENKVSEEIAKSADALVNAQLEKFENLSKSVDALTEKIEAISASIAALVIPTSEEIEKSINAKAEELSQTFNEKVETVEKSIDAAKEENETLKKAVETLENEPVQKSATVVVEEETTIAEEAPVAAPTRQELINKAVAELNTASNDRKAQLFKAISRLEAGVELDKITF